MADQLSQRKLANQAASTKQTVDALAKKRDKKRDKKGAATPPDVNALLQDREVRIC